MKILQVVHSFLPHTMAGTEIYSYRLSKELAKDNNVSVFYRVNDPKKQEYSIEKSSFDGIETYAINHTFRLCSSFRDTYQNRVIDNKFSEILDRVKPDVVHIQHLLFLSYGIIDEIKRRDIPIVFTLHDYWLICHRGQLIRDDLTVCKSNSIAECETCLKYLLRLSGYSMYFYRRLRRRLPYFLLELFKRTYLVLTDPQRSREIIEERKNSMEKVNSKIDLFIAPSQFIRNKFVENGFLEDKILFSPCGFNYRNFGFFPKRKSSVLRFAYMGTLLPMKGVDILVAAFKEIKEPDIELSIYGELFSYCGFESYPGRLKKIAKKDKRIKFKGAYLNNDVSRILADIDLLIVPSIWPENSPLVIQEAFLSKTPVVASRIGGIPELVDDRVNGLLFNPGDTKDLQEKLEYVIDNPAILEKFRENMPDVKDIECNAREITEIYHNLIAKRRLCDYAVVS